MRLGELGRRQDAAAAGPRSVLCVVNVTMSAPCSTGFGCCAAGDEPGDVRGVEHEQRADLVGDLAERARVDDARVGGGAGDDDLGPFSSATSRTWSKSMRSSLGDAVGDEAGRACRWR